MDGRSFHNSIRRLKQIAEEVPLSPQQVSGMMQPFIEQWKPVPTPNRKNAEIPMDDRFQLSPNAIADLNPRIRAIGMNLNKYGHKGIRYHNAFQRELATLALQFDCRGWTESAATFDEASPAVTLPADSPVSAGGSGIMLAIPATADEGPPDLDLPASLQRAGRVDVIWARERTPVAIFEIDSTVKARSFQKLKEAAAPHKFWVYFGKDVWGFRTFLQKNDPAREIIPVLIPQTFIPSFEDQGRHVIAVQSVPHVEDN